MRQSIADYDFDKKKVLDFFRCFLDNATMDDLKDLIEKMAHGGDDPLPFNEIDFGKELGLSEEQIEGLKAMLPKLTTEFLQGGCSSLKRRNG